MKAIPVRHINTAQQEPDLSGSFGIRLIRDLLAGKDMVQPLHRHDFFFVLVLQKGKGDHTIDFTPYKVSDHTVFFMRPGQVHQLTLKAGSSGYLVQFNTNFYYPHNKALNRVLHKAGSINFYQPDANTFKKLLAVLTTIFREYTAQKDMYQDVIKANLGIFFIELARQHSNSATKEENLYKQERLDELLQLVATHMATHKQVSDYAGMMHLSPWQLNAITKALLNKNCLELINEYVILEAKRYLLATSGQVSQIAGHLGYEDVSYFIRFFKKHTGYTPEAFRNNYR